MGIYKLSNICMKGNEHGELKANTIYANLIDPDGHLAISATLEYILSEIRRRDLAVEGVTVKKTVERGEHCSQILLNKY